MSEGSSYVMLLMTIAMVTVLYFYFQSIVYQDRDPNFIWNLIGTGQIKDFPKTTENQRWAFFIFSTINLLICILLVAIYIFLLGLL